MSRRRVVRVHMSEESYRLLEVLTKGPLRMGDDVPGIVAHLVHSCADGIRRPGSWERGWVEQAFGSVPEDLLEEGDQPWRRRPIGDIR